MEIAGSDVPKKVIYFYIHRAQPREFLNPGELWTAQS